MYEINPEKVPELTDREKLECTVLWLNDLYNGYRNLLYGDIDVDTFLEKVGQAVKKNAPIEKSVHLSPTTHIVPQSRSLGISRF